MEELRADMVAQFKAVTDCNTTKAQQYLQMTEYNLEQAIELFFGNDGADLAVEPATEAPVSPVTRPRGTTQASAINVDEDDDGDTVSPVDDDLVWTDAQEHSAQPSNRVPSSRIPPTQSIQSHSIEDDEAMARRLQEEMFKDEPAGSGATSNMYGDDGVRAPIAQRTETLVGPDDDYIHGMLGGRGPHYRQPAPGGRAGIFNQRNIGNIWEEEQNGTTSAADYRRRLAQATGGASETSKKASQLAEMFRPPFEIMSNVGLEDSKDLAREEEKWLLVNIQDSGVFDSQILNRDMWKDPQVKALIKESFVFCQYQKDSPDGIDYIRLYMAGQYGVDYPHIAILDPRTGEQLKVWARVPDKAEFIMQLHEFLDRYSLSHEVVNPVQSISKPKVNVDTMTEEEMLDLALRNSLGNADNGANGVDPDSLTKSEGKKREEPTLPPPVGQSTNEDLMNFEEDTPAPSSPPPESTIFNGISSTNHHTEPAPNAPNTTRVQIRQSDGSRTVRRFTLSDSVRRIFEYVKADLLPSISSEDNLPNKEFELRSMSRNLIDQLDSSIEEAGLKMGTIMMEIL